MLDSEAAFEDIEVSPRTRSMGSAFMGLKADVYAPFHLASSLAWIENIEATGSFLRPFGLDFASQAVISGVGRLPGNLGGVGIGIRRFGVEYGGENLTGETTVALGYGVRLLDDLQSQLSLGATLNWYSLDYGLSHVADAVDPGSDNSITIDISAQAVVQERTTVGFYAQNVTNTTIGSLDKEELRRRVGVGVSYQPYRGVSTMLDITTEQGEEVQYRGGAEFQVIEYLWVRGGIRTQPNIFTAGIGAAVKGIRLDYGFSTGGGVLDATHHIGIGYSPPDRQ